MPKRVLQTRRGRPGWPGAARRRDGSLDRLGDGPPRHRAPYGREKEAAPSGCGLGLMSVGRKWPPRLYPMVQLYGAAERPSPPAWCKVRKGFASQGLPTGIPRLTHASPTPHAIRRGRWNPPSHNRFNKESGDHPLKRDSPNDGLVSLPHLSAAKAREREKGKEDKTPREGLCVANIPLPGTRILPPPV